MNAPVGLEKCASFIRSQWQSHQPLGLGPSPGRLAVTITRDCGSGGRLIAQRLAEFLRAHFALSEPAWKVVEQNLVEQVLQDHHLPLRLAQFMPEDRVSAVADVLDELLGVRPSSWTLVQQTAATILRLANQGNVILVGRAANLVTRELAHVFHVRLVGSLARRCQRIQETEGLSKEAALQFIAQADRGRERYLKTHFQHDPHDPSSYHLVINTDFIPCERAARLIGEELLTTFLDHSVGQRVAESRRGNNVAA